MGQIHSRCFVIVIFTKVEHFIQAPYRDFLFDSFRFQKGQNCQSFIISKKDQTIISR